MPPLSAFRCAIIAWTCLLALAGCADSPDIARIEHRVTRIERSAAAVRAHQLRQRWAAACGQDHSAPPPAGAGLLPHSLPDLEAWSRRALPEELARRVELLRRDALLAVVASDPDVARLEERAANDGTGVAWPALIAARQRAAQQLGYEGFRALWHDAQGVRPGSTDTLLEALDDATREPAFTLVHALEGELGRRPTHADVVERKARAYAILDGALDEGGTLGRALETLAAMGLTLEESALEVHARIDQGGFAAYPIDPPRDVRLVVRSGGGLANQHGVLHELGHAVFYTAPRGRVPAFDRAANRFVAEGVAKFFERLPFEREWLERIGAIRSEASGSMPHTQPEFELLRARELLGRLRFEQAAYAAGGRDLDALYQSELSEATGLDRGADREGWRALTHLASQPFSSEEYLLARLIQCQLRRTLRAHHGATLLDPAVGRALRESVIAPGARANWHELIEKATGNPPSFDAYLEDELKLGERP